MNPVRIQRFEVVEHLGTGGMGTVYRARDPQLEREVAIKVLADAGAVAPTLSPDDTVDLRGDSPSSSDELLREARMMARLSHPNVLPVYEVGLSDGSVFLVMEHIDGTDLATWLEQPRTTEAILDVFAQAARGLAGAHTRGVIHRDFKPANVLVGGDGRVRVADFGLSRLSTPSLAGMVRIDDGRGTPRYMAPELWQGAAATTHSDVFAFCTALAEALGIEGEPVTGARPHALSPRLRAVLDAGRAEDPAARCELDELIAVLEGRSPQARRRWMVAAAAAALLGTAGAVSAFALVERADPAAACKEDRAVLAGVWDAERFAKLRKALAPQRTPAVIDAAERILSTIEEKQKSILAEQRAICVAKARGELAAPALATRGSCLDRRVLELGATVDRLLTGPWNLKDARLRADRLVDATSCNKLRAPAMTADRRAVAELYARCVVADELAVPKRSAEHGDHLSALARDAERVGERELLARTAFALGVERSFQDRLTDAYAEFERSRRIATEIGSTALAAHALAMRADIELRREDKTLDQTLAELQRVAEEPLQSVEARMRVYGGLSSAEVRRDNYQAALAWSEKGLHLAADSGRVLSSLELDLRTNRFDALSALERHEEALASAKEMVTFVKEFYGERDPQYGAVLPKLADAMDNLGDHEGAVQIRRQAIAAMAATLPENKATVVFAYAALAHGLQHLGAFGEARAELARVLEQSATNEALRPYRDWLLSELAWATFDSGNYEEGIRLAREAYREAIALRGPHDLEALEHLSAVAELELELGRLDRAEHELAELERGYRALPEPDPTGLASAQGAVHAAVANRRGKPKLAETIVRTALATLDELNKEEMAGWLTYHNLGDSLVAQGRPAEARAAYDQAIAEAKSGHADPEHLAIIEIGIARTEAASGQQQEAIARARRAKAVLAKYPGQVLARGDVDRLLAGK